MLASVAGIATLYPIADSALAQEAETTEAEKKQSTDLETGLTGEEVEVLNTITVYATRGAVPVLDVPSNVTVVTAEDIEKYQINDMQELTRYIPGVSVSRQTSATDPFNTFSGFTIRGVSGNRVQMLVDGSRVAERIVDGTRDYLDFNFTKQVDVVRGPASVLWGADALGGIVAVETLDPEDVLQGRDKGGFAKTSFDSFTTTRTLSGGYAYRFSDAFSVFAGVAAERGEEPRLSNARADGGRYGCPRDQSVGQLPCNKLDPTQRDSIRGLFKASWTPTSDHGFEFTADALKRDTNVDYTRTLGSQSNGDFMESYERNLDLYRHRFGLQHTWTPDSSQLDQLKTTIAYVPHGYKSTGTERGEDSSNDSYTEENTLEYTEQFFELDTQATKTFGLGQTQHELIFGFDGDYTLTDYSRSTVRTNLATGSVTETRGGGFNFSNATTIRADLFLQDKIELFDSRLEVTPGLRWATYRLDPRPNQDYRSSAGFEPEVKQDQAILKTLSAMLHVNDTYSVWAKYGEGFKMPTAQQLYTSLPGNFFSLIPAPDLEPESVQSVEAGLRGKFARGYFSATAFYADYDNFIQNFYNIPNTTRYTYRNLSSVQVWGVELEGEFDITSDLTATGALSWQRGLQKANEEADVQDHTVAPVTAVLGLNYALADYGLSFDAVTTLAAPVSNVTDNDTFKPGGYALLDLFGSWAPHERVNLNFGVRNVFDTRYFEQTAAGRTLSPSTNVARQNPLELMTGPGRTFSAALNITF